MVPLKALLSLELDDFGWKVVGAQHANYTKNTINTKYGKSMNNKINLNNNKY